MEAIAVVVAGEEIADAVVIEAGRAERVHRDRGRAGLPLLLLLLRAELLALPAGAGRDLAAASLLVELPEPV